MNIIIFYALDIWMPLSVVNLMSIASFLCMLWSVQINIWDYYGKLKRKKLTYLNCTLEAAELVMYQEVLCYFLCFG
jgi:hypothetical protein